MEVGGGLTRLAMGAGHCRCGHFSPAQPWAIVRQAAIGHAAPTHCRSKDDHPPPVPFLCAAFREQEGQLVGITADCTNDIPCFQ